MRTSLGILAGTETVADGADTPLQGDIPIRGVGGLLTLPGPVNITGSSNTFAGSILQMTPQADLASAGTASGSAAALAPGVTKVTGANGTAGVIMTGWGVGILGMVINDPSANAVLKIYPPAGGTLNGGSPNAALSVAAKAPLLLYTKTATEVYSLPLVPS